LPEGAPGLHSLADIADKPHNPEYHQGTNSHCEQQHQYSPQDPEHTKTSHHSCLASFHDCLFAWAFSSFIMRAKLQFGCGEQAVFQV
jgi:hypothetical protein